MRLVRSKWLFAVVWVLLALGKLLLVAQNEIISIADDSAGYVRQSLRSWSLDFPPGYSTWLALSRPFGVPQRIEIEILYLFSAVCVALTVKKFSDTFAATITLALLAFTPYTFFLFNHALSDGFFICLTLLCLAVTLRLFTAVRKKSVIVWSIVLGLLLGVTASTRNEDPLIAFWIIAVVVTCAFLWREERIGIRQWLFWRRAVSAGLITAAITTSIVVCVEFSYCLVDGVYARNISLIPGHVELLKHLAEIDTGEPQRKWVPISRVSRELAYRESPTLASMRGGIEAPMSDYQLASRAAGLPAGEIGGGWIWHAINAQIFPISQGRLTNAEAIYEKINRELESAFKARRLKRRFVLHPLLGADLSGIMSRVPASLPPVLLAAFSSLPDYINDQNFQPELFDKALLRRAALIEPRSQIVVQGWAFVNAPGRKLLNAFITSADSVPYAVNPIRRPDVEKVFAKQNGWPPNVLGFSATVYSQSPEKLTIHYLLDNGAQIEAGRLEPMQVSSIENKHTPRSEVIQGVDLVQAHAHLRSGIDYAIQLWLLRTIQAPGLKWCVVALVVLAFLLNCYALLQTAQQQRAVWLMIFSFILVLWCARILFYSVLDAAAWEGSQVRYLAPAHALGLVLLSISFASLLQQGANRWSLARRDPTPTDVVHLSATIENN